MSGIIKFTNATLRDPLSQILENKELIAKHYEIDRALANLGIKVVGQVTTKNELPNPATYTGDYGDAFAVGDKEAVIAGTATYDYYVYTRPSPDTGEPYNHWLDVGKISIQGPTGATPILSNNGQYITSTDPQTQTTTNVISIADLTPEATKWYDGSSVPTDNSQYQEGDMLIIRGDGRNAGNVYRFNGTSWSYVTNLKGPQGTIGNTGPAPEMFADNAYIKARDPQTGTEYNVVRLSQIRGPRGEQGVPGKFIYTRGIVANKNQLPPPSTLNDLNAAYLVGAGTEEDPYKLYIQVGASISTAEWKELDLGMGTTVTVDGETVSTFDADTKLDKVTEATVREQVYGKAADGSQAMYTVTANPIASRIPRIGSDNSLNVALEPVNEYSATSKKYVDDNFTPKLENTDRYNPMAYVVNTDNSISAIPIIAGGYGNNSIVQRNTAGHIITKTADYDTGAGTYCVSLELLRSVINKLKEDNNLV